ncbi:MAG: hypothetical protein ACLR6T_08980 [Intestinibacter sp.]
MKKQIVTQKKKLRNTVWIKMEVIKAFSGLEMLDDIKVQKVLDILKK